ncbi:hypothetical protein K503DRAFT_804197 [Rhizopogon vinicolor AM-OR11-026]|uniref:Uncharacterized protein n=1 Tax=Rhizopogon vinicolor AM-OR11-026 TaxID=1314800 RepID=A0A1B7MM35_9AGAM|nr:hypothetical protein K503DRAFT_804197 [Rhizopogon vinicolor AM-OR11-026]
MFTTSIATSGISICDLPHARSIINAYAWDIYVILKESGHEDLLSISDVTPNTLAQKAAGAKLLTDSDPIQRRRPALREHDRLPQSFFGSPPDNVHMRP